MPDATPLELAYLVSQYPAPSHVFIEREILGMRGLGARVDTFSVRPTPEDLLLSPVMGEEARRTTVLQDKRAVAAAVGRLARHHPKALASVSGRAARTGERTARSRTWQGFYLAEAARLYEEMVHRGLRHVHVHFPNNSADVARLVVALGRAIDGAEADWRWSLSVHGPTEFEAVEKYDLAAKIRDADGVACISDFTRSQLMRLVEPELWGRFSIVRMSVDLTEYQPPISPRRDDGVLRVLTVGRLVPEKGSPVLVDALERLRDLGVSFEARLVGGGELEPLLRRRIETAGLSRHVSLTGPLGQHELPAQYHWADVFCLPSFQEGLPVVLMEAMATELPVVTTAIAGIPELVQDGHTGRVLTPGRPDLIAGELAQLGADVARRRLWGQAGRRRVQSQHDLAITAVQQLDFLTEVRPRWPRHLQST
jgi:colanic acid/amylovoran biosynthesis glycosyltransferase